MPRPGLVSASAGSASTFGGVSTCDRMAASAPLACWSRAGRLSRAAGDPDQALRLKGDVWADATERLVQLDVDSEPALRPLELAGEQEAALRSLMQGDARKRTGSWRACATASTTVRSATAPTTTLRLADTSGHGSAGAAEITALIRHYAAGSPEARVFVACGSMGGALCWELARDDP